jgi:hypothetical protein
MRPFTLLAVTLLAASSAWSQQLIKLTFAHTEGEKSMQEVATLVRTIADIADVNVDAGSKTLSLAATPDKLRLAQWLFSQLDTSAAPAGAKLEYQMPEGDENIVQIFFLHNMATVQNFQEVATAVRTVADIRRVFTYNEPRAMVVRGTEDQIALAEWLVGQMDLPTVTKPWGPRDYRMAKGFQFNDSAVRVFYLAHTATPKDFQGIASMVRNIATIRRVFTYNELRAMVVRGAPEQIELADFLVTQLDTMNTGAARQSSAVYNYQTAYRDNGPEIKVFFLNHAGTDDFLKATSQVRALAGQGALVATDGTTRALVFRGTTDQLSVAEQVLKDVQ